MMTAGVSALPSTTSAIVMRVHAPIDGGIAMRSPLVELAVATAGGQLVFEAILSEFFRSGYANSLSSRLATDTVFVLAIITVGAVVDITGLPRRLLSCQAAAATFVAESLLPTTTIKVDIGAFFRAMAHIFDARFVGIGTGGDIGPEAAAATFVPEGLFFSATFRAGGAILLVITKMGDIGADRSVAMIGDDLVIGLRLVLRLVLRLLIAVVFIEVPIPTGAIALPAAGREKN